jgi:hypothetical protein
VIITNVIVAKPGIMNQEDTVIRVHLVVMNVILMMIAMIVLMGILMRTGIVKKTQKIRL